MTLYFAYGANLDRAGMAHRCPTSTLLGLARLDHHRFIVMSDGYATVLPAPGGVVHGLLWHVAADDWAALDDYEEVDAGLYRRAIAAVTGHDGLQPATIYLASSSTVGTPVPGYMERVLAAADACGLPVAYRAELKSWLVWR